MRSSPRPDLVYLQPDGLPDCRILKKTLKRLGSKVTEDPEATRFFIVSSSTNTGRNLVRDWSSEKVILEHLWISECDRAGRLLTEADNWGGFLLNDEDAQADERKAKKLRTANDGWSGAGASSAFGSLPLSLSPPGFHPPPFSSIFGIPTSAGMPLWGFYPFMTGGPMNVQYPNLTADQGQCLASSLPPPIPKRSHSPAIFLSSGHPVQFWIQVEMKERRSLVEAIEAHGGTITSDFNGADVAILNPNSDNFKSLRADRFRLKKAAVPASYIWISTCRSEMMDLDHFEFEPPTTVKRERIGPIKSEKKSRSTPATPNCTTRRARSLTPPVIKPVRAKAGYRYTVSEKEYAQRYLEIKRDHMTLQQIAENLHSKFQHHSQSSWATVLSVLSRSKDSVGNSDDTAPEDDTNAQIETIAHFFARCECGGEAEDTLSRRYKRLARYAPSKSAEQWEAFLSEHYPAIQTRFNELVRAAGYE